MKKLSTILILAPMLALAGAPTGAPVGAERHLIAAGIIAEAGGECREGIEAVWEVIHNRTQQRKRGYTTVVTRRKQYSCLNNTTTTSLKRRMSQHTFYLWVYHVLLSTTPKTNHTGGANHYHATRVSPKWAKGQKQTRIGRHRFYKIK